MPNGLREVSSKPAVAMQWAHDGISTDSSSSPKRRPTNTLTSTEYVEIETWLQHHIHHFAVGPITPTTKTRKLVLFNDPFGPVT